METILLIGLGGFIGANVRYWLSGWIAGQFAPTTLRHFPLGTLVINVTGSALLAAFIAWTLKRADVTPQVKLFIATGFFGGYTTFSTFATESIALIQAGNWISGLTNIIGTNLLALVGVVIGLAVGSRLA
ncbi:MAG TPA: fluoride efflux transporter CrcB [Phototrophicaceae bacterium]|nr:fluoride efflux transporter CrcB [Phototrophicaceae bacterium]